MGSQTWLEGVGEAKQQGSIHSKVSFVWVFPLKYLLSNLSFKVRSCHLQRDRDRGRDRDRDRENKENSPSTWALGGSPATPQE